MLARLAIAVARRPLQLMGILLAAMCAATLVLKAAEQPVNPQCRTVWDALWLIVVLVMSGFEQFPVTLLGRVMGVLVVVGGLAMVAVFQSAMTSVFVEHRLRGVTLVHDFTDCVLICGWDERARHLLSEIHGQDGWPTHPVVVLAPNVPDGPLPDDPFVKFVKGNAFDEADLRSAHVDKCSRVVILADHGSEQPEAVRDALSVMVCQSVRSLGSRRPHITAEALDSRAEAHLRQAGADEVILTGEMGARMLAQAVLTPGSAALFSELLTTNEGNETYCVDLPESWVGHRFGDLLRVAADRDFIPVALVRSEEGLTGPRTVRTNPPRHERIRPGDRLIVIAETKPQSFPDA